MDNYIIILNDKLDEYFKYIHIIDAIDEDFFDIDIKKLNKLIKKLNKLKEFIIYINNKKLQFNNNI